MRRRNTMHFYFFKKVYYHKMMHSISLKDTHYPALLREIHNPPENIYWLGRENVFKDANERNTLIVAIVGTRRPTRYGIEVALELSGDLASHGAIVVSGLALGIDAAAHKGALAAGGKTWAVLGSGLSYIYPPSNRVLAEEIVEGEGAVISEFSRDQIPEKWTFPRRNRVIAGLSHVTVVVEAPEKSGALITARFALEANREIGAIPGEVFSVHSRGTNALLKEGAALIRNAEDILELLGRNEIRSEQPLDSFKEIEQDIIRNLDKPKGSDELLALTGHPLIELQKHLTMLEIKGVIKNTGGVFSKILK